MVRKWLFGGLTLILVAVLVVLIIQGRQLERHKTSQPTEIIQNSIPTATRAFSPKDIRILQSNMKHEMELHNFGSVPYMKIELHFDYVDRGGKVLASRTYSIDQTIFPDSTLKLAVRIDDVPSQTADFRAAVLYADIGSKKAVGSPQSAGKVTPEGTR